MKIIGNVLQQQHQRVMFFHRREATREVDDDLRREEVRETAKRKGEVIIVEFFSFLFRNII